MHFLYFPPKTCPEFKIRLKFKFKKIYEKNGMPDKVPAEESFT
jgi:hypothetical protein